MALLPYTNRIEVIDFGSEEGAVFSESPFNGSEYVRALPTQRYYCDLEFAPLNTAEYREVMAFVRGLRGRYKSFELIIPTESKPRGSYTTVNTTAGSSGTSLNVGVSPATTFKAGDKFTIAGQTKVYEVAEDTTIASTGTISLVQPLRSIPSAGQALNFNDVQFTMRLSEGRISSRVTPSLNYELSFSVREVL